jgi:hypothetical protein
MSTHEEQTLDRPNAKKLASITRTGYGALNSMKALDGLPTSIGSLEESVNVSD